MNDALEFIYCIILWLWAAFWLYLSYSVGYSLGAVVLQSMRSVV